MSQPRNADGRISAELHALCAEFHAFKELMDERDRRYMEREEARRQAEGALELTAREYRAASNEWRGTLNDVVARMLTRQEYETSQGAIAEKVAEMREMQSRTTGKDEALDAIHASQKWLIALAVTSFLSVLGLLFHILLGR